MWITLTLGVAVAILLVGEKWVGSCPAIYADDPIHRDQCRASQISFKEVTFRILPFFLGGIGLPMAFALPGLGMSCLLVSGVLFFAGNKVCLQDAQKKTTTC